MILREVADVATEASRELRAEFGRYLPDEVMETLQREPAVPHDFQLSDITQVASVVISAASLAWSIYTSTKAKRTTNDRNASRSVIVVDLARSLEVALTDSVGERADPEHLQKISLAVAHVVVNKLGTD